MEAFIVIYGVGMFKNSFWSCLFARYLCKFVYNSFRYFVFLFFWLLCIGTCSKKVNLILRGLVALNLQMRTYYITIKVQMVDAMTSSFCHICARNAIWNVTLVTKTWQHMFSGVVKVVGWAAADSGDNVAARKAAFFTHNDYRC